jgi:tetratricopeptide (TPR) repeat protein
VRKGRALVVLGDLHYHAGRHEESAARFDEALQLARDVDDRWGEGLAAVGLGFTSGPPDSRRHLEHTLRLTRATGDRWTACMALTGLGMILADAGDSADAINHHRQAINLAQEVGDKWWRRRLERALPACAPT